MAEATRKRRPRQKKRAKRAFSRATLMFLSSCLVSVVLGYALGEYAVQLVNDGRFHLPRPREEPLPLTLPRAAGDGGAPAAEAESPGGGSHASAAATGAAAAGNETGAADDAGTDGVSVDVASQLDTSATAPGTSASRAPIYRVQVGDYPDRAAAEAARARLDPQGKNGYYVVAGPPYRVQVGAYSDAANADAVADGLRAQGFSVVVES